MRIRYVGSLSSLEMVTKNMFLCTEKEIIQNYIRLKQKNPSSCGMQPQRRRHSTENLGVLSR